MNEESEFDNSKLKKKKGDKMLIMSKVSYSVNHNDLQMNTAVSESQKV